ncbi:MAG: masK10 [Myxococcaceae bacterium]|nr:masK10 [Myxococcaceae bacterium]
MSETFGGWELLTRLGQNELGETHLALRRADQRQAVLKRFSPNLHSDPTFYEPLKNELQLASTLAHPAAAGVIEQGELDGVAYVAFEHVDGLSLAQLEERARATNGWPLSIGRAVELIRPVLDALSAAHQLTAPLLHRDLIPENVRVTCEGRVVVTDFGLGRARLRAGRGTDGMRRACVSPEQARGHATDARSEVFAAGLMLFELVCGRLPAQGGPGEVISRIATGELDAPLAVNPALDPGAVAVLERALAVRPEARFGSAREFFDALAPWAAQRGEEPLAAWVTRLDGVKVPPPPPPAPPPKAAEQVAAAPVAAENRAPSFPRARRAALFSAALFFAALIASQVVDPRALIGGTPEALIPSGRTLELTSIPSGAQVFVDGVPQERRTPLTLHIPKDELRNVVLKKQGFGAWSGHISNLRKLEVTLVTGELVEDRYEGSRPGTPGRPEPVEVVTQVAPAPIVEEPPKPEVVFDAEAPPLEVVLTAAHSVNGDLGPTIDIGAGAVGSLSEGATLYVNPTAQAYSKNMVARAGGRPNSSPTSMFQNSGGLGGFRVINLFALKNSGGAIEVLDLSKPVTFPTGGQYHLFSPTESGDQVTHSAFVKLNDESIPLTAGNLLRVNQDDSFLIRVLSPKVTYRLELTRADGSAGPLPPVLISMRPDADMTNLPEGLHQNSLRLDGQPLLSGQALLGPGKHLISGARNVWFTILTAQGVVPPDVKLSVHLASAKKKQLR